MDKKLTDNKLMELLQYKSKTGCDLCDIKNRNWCITCNYDLMKNALDLINRLQASNGIYETCNARKDEAIKHLESEVKRLQAENERLERVNTDLLKIADTRKKANFSLLVEVIELKKSLRTAKAEAYKEFAERMKEINRSVAIIRAGHINDLLKEMVGEDK